MKYIKSEKITKRKYLLTLEVSDYDLEMFEDFATTYAPFEVTEEASKENNFGGKYSPDFKKKYHNWMSKVWGVFWKCWYIHDDVKLQNNENTRLKTEVACGDCTRLSKQGSEKSLPPEAENSNLKEKE